MFPDVNCEEWLNPAPCPESFGCRDAKSPLDSKSAKPSAEAAAALGAIVSQAQLAGCVFSGEC
jgi:hypothetical protein